MKEVILSLVEEYGYMGLFVFAFAESIIQPFPVDPLIAAEVGLGNGLAETVFWASLGSILGGIVAYFLGKYLGEPVFLKLFNKKYFTQGHKFFEKWGVFAVLLGAVTPLPFKVIAWLAGIFEMPLIPYIAMVIIGRGGRFLLVAYATDYILF